MAYTTINKGSSYFNTVLYTGDGTTNQTKAITFGFQPDWAWFKARDAGQSHILVDIIRGGTKALVTEAANAEITLAVAQLFTSTGMIVSNDASANSLNSSGSTKVSWGWLGANTTVSNTSGTITSTVCANTTSGFSVVGYTGNGTSGPTFGHGLGVTPKFVIVKNREVTEGWPTWINNSTRLMLNTTAGNAGNFPISTSSTLITLPNFDGLWNSSGVTYIAYCFAEIKGYSKFATYTGNGSTDGTFIYTGFKPAFVLYKVSSTTDSWMIMDNKRDVFNQVINQLEPNSAGAASDNVTRAMDFLSNGFKFRSNNTQNNASGQTYIYAAFAENPFVTSGGIPVTAR